MKEYRVLTGSVRNLATGHEDNRRPVTFTAEELATVTWRNGNSGFRGTRETLFRTQDDRLIVLVEDWSNWQGETSVYTLLEPAPAEFDSRGRFETLARKAGLCRDLTLDEALTEDHHAWAEDW